MMPINISGVARVAGRYAKTGRACIAATPKRVVIIGDDVEAIASVAAAPVGEVPGTLAGANISVRQAPQPQEAPDAPSERTAGEPELLIRAHFQSPGRQKVDLEVTVTVGATGGLARMEGSVTPDGEPPRPLTGDQVARVNRGVVFDFAP